MSMTPMSAITTMTSAPVISVQQPEQPEQLQLSRPRHRKRARVQSPRSVAGVDVLTIAGKSISGWFTSYKRPDGSAGPQPYTTRHEQALALYLEYHPQVAWYQRGDAKAVFVEVHRLPTLLPSPYAISYLYEGKGHDYWPDWVGALTDGALLVAEAGREKAKIEPKELAKADAARVLTCAQGGQFWIGTEAHIFGRRYWNYVFLHVRRRSFASFEEIAPAIRAIWKPGIASSVGMIIDALHACWSAAEVEEAAWKIAGEAAAAGRLLVDLDNVQLDLATPIQLTGENDPIILPAPLPNDLLLPREAEDAQRPAVEAQSEHANNIVEDGALDSGDLDQTPHLRGAVFDEQPLGNERQQQRFRRNLAATRDVECGMSIRAAARHHGMHMESLRRFYTRYREKGERALLPYGAYFRTTRLTTTMRPEFVDLVTKLYRHDLRLKPKQIEEHPRMRELAIRLSAEHETTVRVPSYWQIRNLIQHLKTRPEVVADRSGLKHPQRGRTTTARYIASIPAPGLVCQVDEHEIDLHVTAPDGTAITHKMSGAVLICAKTGAVLSAVVSPEKLNEEDYMLLLKRALEPKEKLVQEYGCKHPWNCFVRPAIILSDRGKIFTSARARSVVVERLGIIEEIAPPYAPPVKGVVEAVFKWVVERLEHRLPGTTLANPVQRGRYEPDIAAALHGITLEDVERWWIRGWVNSYMQEYDPLRGGERFRLWDDAVQRFGKPHWIGSSDELKLLLMKAVNHKFHPATPDDTDDHQVHSGKGISFGGRWYFAPGVLSHLYGKQVEIRYSRRDITVIYIFHQHTYVGECYWIDAKGRRISEWEWKAVQTAKKPRIAAATAESDEALAEIYAEAHLSRGERQKALRKQERSRQHDRQRAETHPQHVLDVLEAVEQEIARVANQERVQPAVNARPDSAARPARSTPRSTGGMLPSVAPRTPQAPIRRPVIRQ